MFVVRKTKKTPIVVIRAASGYELSNYEKSKLAQIEPGAQINKIETIALNGKMLQIGENKNVNIELGEHALKQHITPEDLSAEELFMIECKLDESELEGV